MFTRTVLTMGLIGFAVAPAAKADTYGHIEDLAHRLDRSVTQLDQEFAAHYRHTREYGHLHNDSVQMVRLARHIHAWAHSHGDVQHLASDLRQLDRLFHHVEGVVDDLEHHAGYHDPYGWHGHRRGGHVHGETSHVRRLLSSVEVTLHHLQDDLEQLSAAQPGYYNQPSVTIRPQVNPGWGGYPRGYAGAYNGQPGPTIRFSHPGFSIWLGR